MKNKRMILKLLLMKIQHACEHYILFFFSEYFIHLSLCHYTENMNNTAILIDKIIIRILLMYNNYSSVWFIVHVLSM